MPLFVAGAVDDPQAYVRGHHRRLALGLLAVSSSRDRPAAQVGAGPGAAQAGVQWITIGYVAFCGTPLFVQILLVHFALMPTLIRPDHGLLLQAQAAMSFRQEHGAFFSGALALTLNAGAYILETFRAGIQSIHVGQTQAAYSLGLTHGQSMRFVILPQAFRRMVPPLVNEAVTLIKDSPLVSAIGLAVSCAAARTVAGAYSRYWEPYLTISAIYLVLYVEVALLAKRLEAPAHPRGRDHARRPGPGLHPSAGPRAGWRPSLRWRAGNARRRGDGSRRLLGGYQLRKRGGRPISRAPHHIFQLFMPWKRRHCPSRPR